MTPPPPPWACLGLFACACVLLCLPSSLPVLLLHSLHSFTSYLPVCPCLSISVSLFAPCLSLPVCPSLSHSSLPTSLSVLICLSIPTSLSVFIFLSHCLPIHPSQPPPLPHSLSPSLSIPHSHSPSFHSSLTQPFPASLLPSVPHSLPPSLLPYAITPTLTLHDLTYVCLCSVYKSLVTSCKSQRRGDSCMCACVGFRRSHTYTGAHMFTGNGR